MSDRLKVLVAGFDYSDNQITRKIAQDYDCEVIHVDGNTARDFPHFCDAAIVAKAYISHQKFYDVKDTYRNRNRPVFITHNNFTHIQDKFEGWLLTRRGFVKPPPRVFIGDLAMPASWVDPKAPVPRDTDPNHLIQNPTKEREPSMANMYAGQKFSEVERKLRDTIVINAIREGKTYDEASDLLNKSTVRKFSGNPWTRTDVNNLVAVFRNRGILPPSIRQPEEKAQPAPKPAAAPAPQAPVELPKPTIDPMLLIQQISGSELDAMDKVRLIAKVSMGEIKTAEFIDKAVVDGQLYIEKVSILRAKDKNPNLTLTVDQAKLLLENLGALNDFVSKGQV